LINYSNINLLIKPFPTFKTFKISKIKVEIPQPDCKCSYEHIIVFNIINRDQRDDYEVSKVIAARTYDGLADQLDIYLQDNREDEDYLEDEEFAKIKTSLVKLARDGALEDRDLTTPELNCMFVTNHAIVPIHN
jgi:hypothetical protein